MIPGAALADGGTIFLDEFGELPLERQGKLLRVLQEGEFEPVEGSRARKGDVRVIAATNRDLKDPARAGTFREDLCERLNVFPIRVPPLRERGEDVALLASSFVERFARELGREIAPPDEAARIRLRAYDWRGNVRELRSVMERAAITARRGRIDLGGCWSQRPRRLLRKRPMPCRARTAPPIVCSRRRNCAPSSAPTSSGRSEAATGGSRGRTAQRGSWA